MQTEVSLATGKSLAGREAKHFGGIRVPCKMVLIPLLRVLRDTLVFSPNMVCSISSVDHSFNQFSSLSNLSGVQSTNSSSIRATALHDLYRMLVAEPYTSQHQWNQAASFEVVHQMITRCSTF